MPPLSTTLKPPLTSLFVVILVSPSDISLAIDPATWGAAIDVPVNTALRPLIYVETIFTPGAVKSVQDP